MGEWHLWLQDPYNWYVVVVCVVTTHSKNLLENSQNWQLSKLKVVRVESCQNWKYPKLKVAKFESWENESCQNCQSWKLLSC